MDHISVLAWGTALTTCGAIRALGILAAALAAWASTAAADGSFVFDVTAKDMRARFGSPEIGDLQVGDKGRISAIYRSLCADRDGALFVPPDIELVDDAEKPAWAFTIKPGRRVDLKFDYDGDLSNRADKWELAVWVIGKSRSCPRWIEIMAIGREKLLRVETVQGKTRLSDLMKIARPR